MNVSIIKNSINFNATNRQRAFAAMLGLQRNGCSTAERYFSDTAVYGDAVHVGLAVTGVYDAAQSGFYNSNTPASGVRGYPFGAASSDLSAARGEDVTDMAGFLSAVYTNALTVVSPNVVYIWANCYSVINKANISVARMYGSIHQPSQHSGPGHGRRGLNQNADLNFAETNISVSSTLKTRATRGATVALKQCLRLCQGNWAAAITEGNKLITGTTSFTSPAALGGYATGYVRRC